MQEKRVEAVPCVLVVEDNEANLYYLRALLEGHGYEVAAARHGAEALVMARQRTPQLIVSDLLMPVMDGYTLLRHCKADPLLRDVPFVVYTATYTEAEDERLALELGADAFILKPCEPIEFLRRVNEVEPRGMPPVKRGSDTLELYSHTLIRKLEEKSLQLQEANRVLEQEHAELLLRDRAIRAVSQGILITDPHQPDNPIIYASPGFELMTGYEAREVLGRNCRFLQGRDTDPAAVAELRAALAEGRACTTELLNYRRDGTPFWNSLAVSPVLSPDGKLLHFVGVQTDVTERRELEAQLRQAQKMEAIGQLAAGVAHDFNNLLSVVLTYSILVLDQLNEADDMYDDVSEIRRAGERGTELVRQLLAFSRRQVLQPCVLDLGELLLSLRRMLERALGVGNELSLLVPARLGKIRADPTQVEQILMNLTVNARDAMSAGTLRIEARDVDLDGVDLGHGGGPTSGPYVLLSVRDTGTGMDDATRERIFEPFFTTKEAGKGTGLGLSTVFGIVKQSQGHIAVKSALGHGTTFDIYLPRVEDAVKRVSAAPEPATLRGRETVLVVEDDEHVRTMMCRLLRRAGYEVLDAQNGGEALLICEQHPTQIDLLLTDLVLPRLDGRQLAARLRALRPSMKVLLTSGYAEEGAGPRGSTEEIPLVQKPITPDALLRGIRSVLGPEGATEPA